MYPLYSRAIAYLREEVLLSAIKVQKKLQLKKLCLKIWDAYRPFSVQEKMWQVYPDEKFLAKPIRSGNKLISGSKHSRGAALDVTIVDSNGHYLTMPSYFDEFSVKSHRKNPDCSLDAKKNMNLLEDIMKDHGFIPLPTEWWHFDWHNWKKFELIDFVF